MTDTTDVIEAITDESAGAAENPEACPVVKAVDEIGFEWALVIRHDLVDAGEKRFNKLKRSTGANSRTLSRVLDDPEEVDSSTDALRTGRSPPATRSPRVATLCAPCSRNSSPGPTSTCSPDLSTVADRLEHLPSCRRTARTVAVPPTAGSRIAGVVHDVGRRAWPDVFSLTRWGHSRHLCPRSTQVNSWTS